MAASKIDAPAAPFPPPPPPLPPPSGPPPPSPVIAVANAAATSASFCLADNTSSCRFSDATTELSGGASAVATPTPPAAAAAAVAPASLSLTSVSEGATAATVVAVAAVASAAAAALGKTLAEALLEADELDGAEDPRVPVLGRVRLFPLALPSMARLFRLLLLLLSDPPRVGLRLACPRLSLAAMAASITVSKALRRATAALAGWSPLCLCFRICVSFFAVGGRFRYQGGVVAYIEGVYKTSERYVDRRPVLTS